MSFREKEISTFICRMWGSTRLEFGTVCYVVEELRLDRIG